MIKMKSSGIKILSKNFPIRQYSLLSSDSKEYYKQKIDERQAVDHKKHDYAVEFFRISRGAPLHQLKAQIQRMLCKP